MKVVLFICHERLSNSYENSCGGCQVSEVWLMRAHSIVCGRLQLYIAEM